MCATYHQVVAATRPDMQPIELELFCSQMFALGGIVQLIRLRHELVPAVDVRQVHLEHARIGGHPEHAEARIDGRWVTLYLHGQPELTGRGFDRSDELTESVGGVYRGQ